MTATFPCGQQLGTIAQMLLGAVELSLWHDVAEMMTVRRVAHEVVCHLERIGGADADLSVRLAASPDHLEIDLSLVADPNAHVPDRWILDLAAESFDEVTTQREGDRLTVRLGASPPAGGRN